MRIKVKDASVLRTYMFAVSCEVGCTAVRLRVYCLPDNVLQADVVCSSGFEALHAAPCAGMPAEAELLNPWLGWSLLAAGIVSCMAFAPDGSALAVGTYAGAIGLWDPRVPEMTALLTGGHKGGLTQV